MSKRKRRKTKVKKSDFDKFKERVIAVMFTKLKKTLPSYVYIRNQDLTKSEIEKRAVEYSNDRKKKSVVSDRLRFAYVVSICAIWRKYFAEYSQVVNNEMKVKCIVAKFYGDSIELRKKNEDPEESFVVSDEDVRTFEVQRRTLDLFTNRTFGTKLSLSYVLLMEIIEYAKYEKRFFKFISWYYLNLGSVNKFLHKFTLANPCETFITSSNLYLIRDIVIVNCRNLSFVDTGGSLSMMMGLSAKASLASRDYNFVIKKLRKNKKLKSLSFTNCCEESFCEVVYSLRNLRCETLLLPAYQFDRTKNIRSRITYVDLSQSNFPNLKKIGTPKLFKGLKDHEKLEEIIFCDDLFLKEAASMKNLQFVSLCLNFKNVKTVDFRDLSGLKKLRKLSIARCSRDIKVEPSKLGEIPIELGETLEEMNMNVNVMNIKFLEKLMKFKKLKVLTFTFPCSREKKNDGKDKFEQFLRILVKKKENRFDYRLLIISCSDENDWSEKEGVTFELRKHSDLDFVFLKNGFGVSLQELQKRLEDEENIVKLL